MATRVVPGDVPTVITGVAFVVVNDGSRDEPHIVMLIPGSEVLIPLDESHDVQLLGGQTTLPERAAVTSSKFEVHIYALNPSMIHVEMMKGPDIQLQVKIVPGRPAFAALQLFLLRNGCWPI